MLNWSSLPLPRVGAAAFGPGTLPADIKASFRSDRRASPDFLSLASLVA